MKTFKLCVITLILTSGTLFSCGGGNSSNAEITGGSSKDDSPTSMTETFWKYIQEKKYDAAVDYWMANTNVSKDISAERLEKMRTGIAAIVAWGQKEHEKNGGIKKVEISDENISDDGNNAKVTIEVTYENGKTEENKSEFSKGEDGAWKFGTKMQGN